jgi:thiamine pyrophosphate-dependent acetolactate synthase large subunit-like protein
MTPRAALDILFSFVKDEPVVHATGYLARTAQAAKHRPGNFYMIGSMGMASSIALGIALSKPGKKVIALDGDGAVLMNLGALPTAGALAPANFLHVVIDNESYESTGGQPSYSSAVKLERIAKSSGYRHAARVSTPAALKKALPRFLRQKGPSFLLVRVENDPAPAAPRVADEPEVITRLFSESLK